MDYLEENHPIIQSKGFCYGVTENSSHSSGPYKFSRLMIRFNASLERFYTSRHIFVVLGAQQTPTE